MNRLLSKLLLLALLLPLHIARAAEPIARAAPISLVNEKEPAVIPRGETKQFQFGTVSQANTTVILRIKTRMHTPTLGGSLHFLRIMLNGQEVKPAKSRFAQRLLNKPLSSPVLPDLVTSWYDAGGWNVLYAPDFQLAYTQKYYVGDPYVYELDVTDLTNPIAENRLKITNTATLDFVHRNKLPNDQLDMVIGSLEIETKPGASPMMAVPEAVTPTINRGEPAAGPASYRGEVLPGGGFALHIGKNTYKFDSSFSYPDAGFNRLQAGTPDSGGQKEWKVSTKGNRVTAQGPDYSLVRTVNFGKTHIEISDAITNKHRDAPLGLAVRHELELGVVKDAPIRLAGNPDPALTDYFSYGNPSVHIGTPEGGLGLIAEDQVFRCQARLYTRTDETTKRPVAGLRSEMLKLSPGETYTVQWSVYPVAGPDYYDFINLVRADWGANYTAWGNWVWGFSDVLKLPVEELRARIKKLGIRYFIGSDWVEWAPKADGSQRISFGTDVMSDYWSYRHKEHRDAVAKLRQVDPNIKVFAYYNAMRESAADTATRFKDSLQVDAAGNPYTTKWTHTGASNASYTMVPTLDNSFGKAMLQIADRYMTDLNLDGIYWDEMEGILFGQILTTYNNFDGHSCLLDPKTWRMEREVGIVPLACRPFYDEVVRRTQARGGMLLCNGPTSSKHTLRDKVQRMTEVQHNEYYAFEGNLQTPLGYMSWSDSWDDFLRTFRMAMIPAVGFRTELPQEISSHLFPFTPIEIHSGYLLGRERIIATHSGNYGWQGERTLVQVRHFDRAGKLTTTDFSTALGSEARTAVTLGEKEAIVLERLPLEFAPTGHNPNWKAEASGVRYEETGISLQLNAPQGGTLTLHNGDFPLKNGETLKVQLGTNSAQSIKTANGALKFVVPAGFVGTMQIRKK